MNVYRGRLRVVRGGDRARASLIAAAAALVAVLALGAGAFALGGDAPAPREKQSALECQGKTATIVGTARNDRGETELKGTDRRDVIVGRGGNDVIRGLGGKDIVCAGNGEDDVNGGAGDDVLRGRQSADLLSGGKGDDKLFGGPARDECLGGAGTNKLRSCERTDDEDGEPGDDGPGGTGGGESGGVGLVPNAPAIANDDSSSVGEDSGATVLDVRANDGDPEGDAVSVQSATDPDHGTTSLTAGGEAISYTPDPDYCNDAGSGPGAGPDDSFSYTVNGGDTATVSVVVGCAPDDPMANDDARTVTEDDPATALNVTNNDTDADGDQVQVTSASDPPNGSAAPGGSGTAVDYTPDPDSCGTDTFTYTVNGGDSATVTVTVDCVDDPPITVDDDPAAIDEDSGANTIDVRANDVDPDGANQITAKTNGADGTVAITNGGADLTYTPDPDYCNEPPGTTPDTFTYTLSPGGSTATVSVDVTCLDDPPVATDDSLTVNEDAAFAAIDVLANDSDGGDGGPFEVDSVDTAATNGDANVTGGGTGVEYRPDPDYCNEPGSAPDDTFTYTLNGGDTGTVSVQVDCVNDAPVNTVPGAQTLDEDTTRTFSTANANRISVADVDHNGSALELDLSVDHGTLTLAGTAGLTFTTGDGTGDATMTFTGTQAAINTALDGLFFTPAQDYNGPATLEIGVDDQGATGSGGAKSDTDTVALTVSAVNDAPVNTVPGAQSTGEDTTLAFDPISVADVDDASLTVELGVTNGTLTLGTTTGLAFTVGDGSADAAMTFAGAKADLNAALDTLQYDPVPDFNGSASLSVQSSDGSLSDSDPVAITVNAQNDAPTVDLDNTTGGNESAATFTEAGGNPVDLAAAADIADVDDANLNGATITLTNPQDGASEAVSVTAAGTSVNIAGSGSHAITLSGNHPKADYQAVIRTLAYDNSATPPDATPSRTVEVKVSDGDVDSNTATSTVTVVPINAAPELDLDTINAGSDDSSAAFTEDSPAVSIAPNSSVTDADVGDDIETATVTLTNPKAGDSLSVTLSGGITGSYNSGTGVLGLTGPATPAQFETVIESITFDNSSETPDETPRVINVVVHDGQDPSVTRTATVSVADTNDAPVNSVPGGTQNLDEDASLAFTGGTAISVADADADASPLEVTLSVNNGVLSLSGTTGLTFTTGNGTDDATTTFAGAQDDVNTALDGLLYEPDPDYNGSDTLQVVTDDQGATGAGGAKTDTDNVALSVAAVNDGPVNTAPGAQAVDEDTDLTFNAANSNVVSVADVDASPSDVRVTLDVDDGVLTLATITGLSFNTGDGTNDANMTFDGTVAEVNAALDGLKYRGDQDFNGSETLTLTTNDQGNTGSGGALQDSDTVAITVNPVNDAPVPDNESLTDANGDNAIGNTALAIGTAQAEPRKSLTGDGNRDLLTGDTDVENDTLSVVAETKATANGGSVTIEADGDFTFLPEAGASCTDASDSFAYQLTDGEDTANGTVTIDLSDCVWYVDNSGANGNGTGSSPFNSLAGINGAGGAGDSDDTGQTLFINDNDASRSYSGGLPLENNQTLRSKRAGLSVGGHTIVTAADGSGNPSITNASGNALGLASGNTVQGIDLGDTPAANASLGGTSVGTATVNTATSGAINNTTGKAVDVTTGTLDATLSSVSSGGGTDGIALDGVGGTFNGNGGTLSGATDAAIDVNAGAGAFSYSGTIGDGSGKSADITNRAGGSVTVSGNINDTNDASGGISLSGNTAGSTTFSGSTKTIDTGGTDFGINLPSSNAGHTLSFTNGGLDLDSSGGTIGLNVQGAVTLNVSGANNTIDSVNAKAVDVDGLGNTVALNTTFASISSSGASADGIRLDDVNGTFTASGGSLQNAGGEDFELTGNGAGDSANVTYDGTITDGAGTVVSIANQTGGTKDFNGLITSTGGGISLSSNSGATNRFDGGLSLSTGTNGAFSATGGGTVNVTDPNAIGTAPDNTLTTTSGTALNVANTTIGASDLNFKSISSNGGGNAGIVLSSTGSSGGLTVTGNGGTCSGTGNCTGGAIQNKTGNGVSFSNTRDVSLTRIAVDNNDGSGVDGDDVTNFSLVDSVVTNNADTATGVEAGLRFQELLGTNAITDTTISGSSEDEVRITPSSGTMNALNVTGSTFGPNSASTGGHGLAWIATNSAQGTINVSDSSFSGIRSTAVLTNVADQASADTSVTTSSFSKATGHPAGVFTTFGTSADADLDFTVSNNSTVDDSVSNAIQLVAGSTSTPSSQITGTISNNAIGNGALDSGSQDMFGIAMDLRGDQQSVLDISGNTVQNTDFEGIWVSSADFGSLAGPSATLDLTLRDNDVLSVDDNSGFPIGFIRGTLVDVRHTTSGCVDMAGNSSVGVGGAEDFRVRQRDTAVFELERLTDGDATPGELIANAATVEAFVTGQNDPGSTADATFATGFTEAANGACATP